MISSQGVHDTFMYIMDIFSILKVIWSIHIWDDVHISVRALNLELGPFMVDVKALFTGRELRGAYKKIN